MTKTSTVRGFIVAAAIVAAAGIGLGAQGSPQAGPGGPGGRRGGPGGPMRGGPAGAVDLPLAQLNLSAQQRDQVKSVVDSHQADLKALGDREMAARSALEQAITADSVDDNVIRQKAADVAAVEADMDVMRAHVRAEVWQLLTPDQQKQAAATPPPGRGGRGRGK